jgi:hypothetical protein
MNIQTKTLQLAAVAVLAISAATAVVLGGTRMRKEVTLPAGTELVAGLEHDVSTAHSRAGDGIALRTVEPIALPDGREIPGGALVHGTIDEAKSGGRLAGAPALTLAFTELDIDGARFAISTQPFHAQSGNDALKSAAEIAGGAVAGGVVGRVLGGKRATLPTAVFGTAIGTGVALQSQGDELVLPAGQPLRIQLETAVTVSYRPHSEKGEKSEQR